MLVLKRASTKKMAVYVSIIVLMLGGTGFMIYQNKKLTVVQPSANDIIIRPEIEAILPSGKTELEKKAAESLKTEAESSRPIDADKIKNNRGFDLSIFLSKKFQELKKNILIIQQGSGLGKSDPFKPN